jgi:hypothetical protein
MPFRQSQHGARVEPAAEVVANGHIGAEPEADRDLDDQQIRLFHPQIEQISQISGGFLAQVGRNTPTQRLRA